MNPNPQSNSGGNDVFVNLGLALFGIAALIAGVLFGAGILTATLTGNSAPMTGLAGALGVFTHTRNPGTALGTPGLNPVIYWIVVMVLVAALTGLGVVGYRLFRKEPDRPNHLATSGKVPGLASRSEIKAKAAPKVLVARGQRLRPSLETVQPSQVGYLIGYSGGVEVWASVEDSILIVGPPRSGKGLHLVINAILDAPGPVITTSTRPDSLTVTIAARASLGPVAVFDPQRLTGLPAGLRWSPMRGCQHPHTAMVRAAGLAAATSIGGPGVESGGFWEGKTRTALQALLHAAALDERTPLELYRWTLDPLAAIDAATILRNHPGAAPGWAEGLEAMINSDPRTRDSIWQGVALSLAALADPDVLTAVSPGPGEVFDPAAFLRANGTLYLLATGSGAGACGSLVAAFIEDLVETARRIAARSCGARLDPPLLLALDEIGNLAPLPSLPTLMAEGGGTGITTMPILQSLAQARSKWGQDAAGTIWDAAIVKIILGGLSEAADLNDISTLLGERDQEVTSTTWTEGGGKQISNSIRRVPVLAPEEIRTLPEGVAITLLRTTRPIMTTLRAWINRRDAGQLTAQQQRLEQQIQNWS